MDAPTTIVSMPITKRSLSISFLLAKSNDAKPTRPMNARDKGRRATIGIHGIKM